MNTKLIDILERLIKAKAKVVTTIDALYHYKADLSSKPRLYRHSRGIIPDHSGAYHMTLIPYRKLHGTALDRYTKSIQETTSNFLKLVLKIFNRGYLLLFEKWINIIKLLDFFKIILRYYVIFCIKFLMKYFLNR